MVANAPNPGEYLNSLTAQVVALREAFDALINADAYLTSVGGATFLETALPNGPGLDSTDAAAVVATLGNLNALATQYNGGAQAPVLNYRENSTPLWSGE